MIEVEEKAFKAYITYLALKKHFTDKKYDFFKYNGKVKASLTSFRARNDKLLFLKLAKQSDVEKFCVANFVYGKSTWLGDFSNDTYLQWLKRNQALTHYVMDDLSKLPCQITKAIMVQNNQHPLLIKHYISGIIGIETLIILNDLSMFFEYWDKNINDKVIWPQIRDKCNRYKPFVEYDKHSLKQKIYEYFKGNETASV